MGIESGNQEKGYVKPEERAIKISREKASERYPEHSPDVAELRQAIDVLVSLRKSLSVDIVMNDKGSSQEGFESVEKAEEYLRGLLKEKLGKKE